MRYLVRSPRRGFSLLDDSFMNDFFNLTSDFPHVMRTDIIEESDRYILNIDIPGYSKEEIKITAEEGYLKIEAVHSQSEEHKDTNYIRRERTYGSTSRTFYLGEVDEDLIRASYNDGILKIDVPKKQEAVEEKVKTITIE